MTSQEMDGPRPGPTSNKKRSPKERKTPATSPGTPQEPRKELSR